MNDFCHKCRVQLSDYDGNFNEILEEVKIEPSEDGQASADLVKNKPQQVTPGAPEILSDRQNGSSNRQ